MSRGIQIIAQAGIYTLSSQIAQFITVVAALLSRLFLGPTLVGVWSTLQIVVEYAKYSTLGTMDSVAREIPYFLGKGNRQAAKEVKNVVFTASLAGSSVIALLISLFALLMRHRLGPEIYWGLFLISGLTILQRQNDFLITLLRCYKNILLISKQMVWSAMVNAIFVAFLTYHFKVYGFIWAMGLSYLFNIVYIYCNQNFDFKFQWIWGRFKSSVLFGLPLMAVGILSTLLRSADRIMIVKFFGFEALGMYSIALMVIGYVSNVANSIAIVMIPHFQEKYGAQDNPQDLKQMLFKSSHAYSLIMPIVMGFAWLISPYLVVRILPEFVSGILPMKVLLIGVFFLSLINPYEAFLIAIKKHWLLIPIYTVSSFVAFSLHYWAIESGFGILGVAYTTSLVFLLNFTLNFICASLFVTNWKESLKRYVFFLAHCVYLVLALLAIQAMIRPNMHSLTNVSGQALAFFLFSVPFFMIIESKFGALSLIRDKLLSKRRLLGVAQEGHP